MKQQCVALLSLIAFIATGCSTAMTAPDAKVEMQKYQEPVNAQDVKSARKSSTCPKDSKWMKESWKTRMMMTNACVGENQWAKVEDLGNYMAQHEPLAPWGPYYLSLSATARKDYSRAMWMVELAIKKSPKEAMLQYQEGKIFWHMEEFAKATKFFEKTLELDPNFHEAHVMLGQIYYRDQNYDRAMKHFDAVLSKDSRHFNALVGRAEMQMKKSMFKEALDDYSRAVGMAPVSMKAPLNEKIKSLEIQLAQQAQPEKVTQREPSQTTKKRVTK